MGPLPSPHSSAAQSPPMKDQWPDQSAPWPVLIEFPGEPMVRVFNKFREFRNAGLHQQSMASER